MNRAEFQTMNQTDESEFPEPRLNYWILLNFTYCERADDNVQLELWK